MIDLEKDEQKLNELSKTRKILYVSEIAAILGTPIHEVTINKKNKENNNEPAN